MKYLQTLPQALALPSEWCSNMIRYCAGRERTATLSQIITHEHVYESIMQNVNMKWENYAVGDETYPPLSHSIYVSKL